MKIVPKFSLLLLLICSSGVSDDLHNGLHSLRNNHQIFGEYVVYLNTISGIHVRYMYLVHM